MLRRADSSLQVMEFLIAVKRCSLYLLAKRASAILKACQRLRQCHSLLAGSGKLARLGYPKQHIIQCLDIAISR